MGNQMIERRIRALEASQGHSKRLREQISRIDITKHIATVYEPVHRDVMEGKHTFYNLPGGRGSGKSSYCALEIISQIMKDATGLSNALVVRKYAVTLRGSVFAQIQWAIDVLGVTSRWHSTITPMQFVFETGQTIRLTGLDDPQKLKSLKPVVGYYRFLWLEEFSEITGELELRNLQQSAMRGGDSFTVFRSFNPPISSANWANMYIDTPDERSLTIRTNYLQIPVEWLGQPFIDEAERLKAINPKAYDHEYMGLPVGNGSEVFPNLEIREITDKEAEESLWIYQGLDWGFAVDPMCFLRMSYDARKETVILLDELYQTHISNQKVAELIIEKGYNDFIVTCDSAEPKSIADLRSCGIVAQACFKRPGAVEYRIRWLQHKKIVIDPQRTPNAYREFSRYSYKVDKATGSLLSELPDKDNHSIDATAYALNRLIFSRETTA